MRIPQQAQPASRALLVRGVAPTMETRRPDSSRRPWHALLWSAVIALGWAVCGSGATAATPTQVLDLATALLKQRGASPVFAERFTIDLRQWGLRRLLGPEGLLLHPTRGTIPGAGQLYVPGLLLHDGVIECEICVEADDEGYVMFRASDDADTAYQFVVTTRVDGSETSGFRKKHNLEQLYGGALVGESYRASYPAGRPLRLTILLRGRTMAALVNGEAAAYYDRSEVRDGSISLFCGSRPLAVRRLLIYAFPDALPAAPYQLSRFLLRPSSVALPGPTPRDSAPPVDASPSFLSLHVPPGGPPVTCAGIVSGSVPDPNGRAHAWRLDSDGRFFLDGEELIPIRSTDGVYFAYVPGSVDHQRAVESIRDPDAPQRLRRDGLPYLPVRLRLVDYLNACGTDHEFSEEPVLGGASRILDIGGQRYRVTSPRRWLSYFAYTLHTDRPLAPHLLLAEAPNDRERFLTVRTHPPDGSGADPEYGVGAGTYTGKGLPVDGKPFCQALLFVPRQQRIRFTVSRMPGEEGRDAYSGAAVSQVFLFALADLPSSRPNPVLAPPGSERTLALAVPSPRALLRQCGVDVHGASGPAGGRAAAWRAFVHYLRFLGFNGLDLGLLDACGEVGYESSRLWRGTDWGVFTELLPLAEGLGIQVTPVIAPLRPDLLRLEVGRRADECALVDCEGRRFPGTLDLLQPSGAGLALDWLSEACSRFRSLPLREVALRVDGDVGGCLTRLGPTPASGAGYSMADVERFEEDTGIDVPASTPAEAFAWLREHAWERWVGWRCEILRQHWLLARSIVRTVAPDARLVLKLALPDREVARPELWFEEKIPPLDLLRAHGFDPRLFAADEGIVLERTLDVGYDRMRSCRHRENSGALDAWDYQAGLAELYRSAEPNAVELSIVPWEEWGQHLGSEFFPRTGGHWGASVVTPWGRHLFRPLTMALRLSDPHRISIASDELATAGREHDWRRFARAFLALPAVPAAAFEGTVALRVPAGSVPGDLVVRTHGGRIAVINDSPQARQVALRPSRPLRHGERWVDVATGRTLARHSGAAPGNPLLLVDLDPFDLRTLVVLADAGAAQP